MSEAWRSKPVHRLPPREYLRYLESRDGLVPDFGDLWYASDEDLENYFEKHQERLHKVVPEGHDPRDWFMERWTDKHPMSRHAVAKYVSDVRKLLGKSAELTDDIEVGCISRFDVGARAEPAPGGGHVIVLNWGSLWHLTLASILYLRLLNDDTELPSDRFPWYQAVYREATALYSGSFTNTEFMDSVSPEVLSSAQVHATVQLYTVLLHEYAHVLLGHTRSAIRLPAAIEVPDLSRARGDIERNHQAELAADRFAAERIKRIDDVLGFPYREHLPFALSTLFETQRVPLIPAGVTNAASVTHPDPRARLEAALPVACEGLDAASIVDAMTGADRLSWAAATGRVVAELGGDSFDPYQPQSDRGKVVLLNYALGLWASAQKEWAYWQAVHDLLPLSVEVLSDYRGAEIAARIPAVREEVETLEGLSERWATLVQTLLEQLLLSAASAATLHGPAFKLMHQREGATDSPDLLIQKRLQIVSREISRLLPARYSGEAWIGGFLGEARTVVVDLMLGLRNTQVRARTDPWVFETTLGEMDRLIEAEDDGRLAPRQASASGSDWRKERARLRAAMEAAKAEEREAWSGFENSRRALERNLKHAVGRWFLIRKSDTAPLTEAVERFAGGLLRDRIMALAESPSLSHDDVREALRLLDDVAGIVVQDIAATSPEPR